MADDKRDNGKRAEHDKKAEDMTPAPTQAELDEHAGEAGKKEKAEREKAAASRKQEDLTPSPTQAEADEAKAALFGTTVEEDKKRRDEYAESKAVKGAKDVDMTPSPTQAENDAAKKAACGVSEGGFAKVETAKSDPPQQHRRHMEASAPRAGYETRSAAPAKAEAE